MRRGSLATVRLGLPAEMNELRLLSGPARAGAVSGRARRNDVVRINFAALTRPFLRREVSTNAPYSPVYRFKTGS